MIFNTIKKYIKKNQKYIFLIIVAFIWIIVLGVFVKDNISNPNFWFDESGQLLMAKGLNHYSPQFAEHGNLKDVVRNNAEFNLDPGGFTIILHYLSMLSDHYVFLRLIPFVLFLCSMIIITKLSVTWRPKIVLSYFSGFILFVSILLPKYAFELRPYSMEMLVTVLCLYFAYKISNILDSKRYAVVSGSLLAVLLWSRYSALFSICALIGIIIYFVYKKGFLKSYIINFIYFLLPIIISAICVFIFTLQYQNISGEPPPYMQEIMFKTGVISDILLNKKVFITIIPFVMLTFLYLISFKNNFLKKNLKSYRIYFVYTIILNFFFISLSILGKYSWSIIHRWDISTHVLFTIAWIPIIFVIIDVFDVWNKKVGKFVQVVILICFLVYTINEAKDYKFVSYDATYDNIIDCGIEFDSSVLINVSAYPTVKYLFEYGPLKELKNEQIYTNIAVFNHDGKKFPREVVDFQNLDEYDYILVTHFKFDDSELKNIITEKDNWEDCANQTNSRILKNMSK